MAESTESSESTELRPWRAWLELPETTGRLALLGDLHGRGGAAARCLQRAGWLDAGGGLRLRPGDLLLQLGDLIDRGEEPGPGTTPELRTETLRRAWAASLIAGIDDEGVVVGPPAAGGGPTPCWSLAELVAGTTPGIGSLRLDEERTALLGALAGLATLRLLRRWQAEAAAAGARAVVLLGNHELDLLRGRCRLMPRQKAHLLALLGVPPRAAAEHLGPGLPLPTLLAVAASAALTGDDDWAGGELAWLASLPAVMRSGELLAVHGGPTRALVSARELHGLADGAGLGRYLEAARAEHGLWHPAFAEGASLFSPDSPEDDLGLDPGLLHQFCGLAGGRELAVGHSPFLHFPKGRWQDLQHEAVRTRVELPARLGPAGELLKTDTNAKRGGPVWLLLRAAPQARWQAVRQDGVELALGRVGEPPVGDEPATARLPPLGESGSEWPAPAPEAARAAIDHAPGTPRPADEAATDHAPGTPRPADGAATDQVPGTATDQVPGTPRPADEAAIDHAPGTPRPADGAAIDHAPGTPLPADEAAIDHAPGTAAAPPPSPPPEAPPASTHPFPPPEGVDADRLATLQSLLTELRERPGCEALGEALEDALFRLLWLGMTDLTPLLVAVSGPGGPPTTARAWVEGLLTEAGERLSELSGRLAQEVAETDIADPQLLVTPQAQTVRGVMLRLAPLAVQQLLEQEPGPPRWQTLTVPSYFAAEGRSWVKAHVFWAGEALPRDGRAPLTAWPPDETELRQRLGALRGPTGMGRLLTPRPAAAPPPDPTEPLAAPAPAGAGSQAEAPGRAADALPAGARPVPRPPRRAQAAPDDPDGEQQVIARLFAPGHAPALAAERAGLRAWLKVNAAALPAAWHRPSGGLPRPEAWTLRQALPPRGFDGGPPPGWSLAPGAGRFLVGPTPDGPWRIVLRLPDGCWLSAMFPDPTLRLSGLRPPPGTSPEEAGPWAPVSEAELLVPQLDGDPVTLFTAVSETVAWLLRQGELEALGAGLDRADRPTWQRARCLYTSPAADILDHLPHKQERLRFEVPRAELSRAAAEGLVALHLYPEAGGQPITPDARFGSRDIGLEVVALEVAGVAWLRRMLVETS